MNSPHKSLGIALIIIAATAALLGAAGCATPPTSPPPVTLAAEPAPPSDADTDAEVECAPMPDLPPGFVLCRRGADIFVATPRGLYRFTPDAVDGTEI